MRRIGKRSNKAHDQSALKMLQLEGFGGTDEPVSAEELPQKLMDAVKGFHEHARYFMFGRSGDTPESLRPLLEAADEADDQIEAYAKGDLAESAANGETRHVSKTLHPRPPRRHRHLSCPSCSPFPPLSFLFGSSFS